MLYVEDCLVLESIVELRVEVLAVAHRRTVGQEHKLEPLFHLEKQLYEAELFSYLLTPGFVIIYKFCGILSQAIFLSLTIIRPKGFFRNIEV